MKGRTFVKKIFVKYKWLLIALLMISIIAIPMVVNILFKFSSAFPAEWSAGDALSYVSGLQALLGTIILGIITVEQGQDAQEVNRRLSEENNRLQKIMSQKLLPAVKLTNPSCKPTMLHRGALSYVPQSKQFRIIRSYYGDSAQHETSEIRVNIDSLVEEIKYIKTIEFSLQNISESIIRHIQVDSVDIVGFQGKTELVACQNFGQGGIGTLLAMGDSVDVSLKLYSNNAIYKELWDDDLAGVAVVMHLTNTTISGTTFSEYIEFGMQNNGHYHINYGEPLKQTGRVKVDCAERSVILAPAQAVIANAFAYLKGFAPETIATAVLFSMVGYFNGNNKTVWVMVQGLVQTLLVRLPMAYFMSIQPNASLTMIGLAAPTSTDVGIVLNICFYFYFERTSRSDS